MSTLEPSDDTPIEIENLIKEELEQNKKFVQTNSDKISEYETSLFKRFQNFQKPVHQDLYKKAIQELESYIKNFGGKQSFLKNVVSFIKLPDLEEFYVSGILKTKDKDILQASFSKLVGEKLRIFNHLALAKTLFLHLSKDDNKILISNFNELLASENIEIKDIETLSLGGKKEKNNSSTDIPVDAIKDKIQSIVISPKEEVKKKTTGSNTQRTGRGASNKTEKPAKVVATKKPKISDAELRAQRLIDEKTRKIDQEKKKIEISIKYFFQDFIKYRKKETSENLFKSLEEEKFKPLIVDVLKEYLDENDFDLSYDLVKEDNNFGTKSSNYVKYFYDKFKNEGKENEIISIFINSENIDIKSAELLRELYEGKLKEKLERRIRKGKRKEKNEKINFEISDISFDTFSKKQTLEFFALLEEYKLGRRFNKSLVTNSMYKSFIENSQGKDFYELLDFEGPTINQGKLEGDLLLAIFKRLISFSKNELVELGKFIGHTKRIESIKNKLADLFDENLNNLYQEHIEKLKEEEKDNSLNIDVSPIILDSITDTQVKVFFTLLEEYKLGRRFNKSLVTNSMYKSFIEHSQDKDFYKLLDLEGSTINGGKLEGDLLLAIFKRLISFSKDELVELGKFVGHTKKIESIKNKLADLFDENLNNLYQAHIEKLKEEEKDLEIEKTIKGIKKDIINLINEGNIDEAIKLLEENKKLLSKEQNGETEIHLNLESVEAISSIEETEQISENKVNELKDEIVILIENGEEKEAITLLEGNIELFDSSIIAEIIDRIKDKDILRNFIMKF